MVKIQPTTEPARWVVSLAGAIECEGITLVGELTGVNPDYDAVYGEGDVAFVEAVQAVAGLFPPLPDSGWLTAGTLYQYGDGVVIVRQSHNRTEHDPADVPALFMVYREDAADVLEWVAGESVVVGTRRTYDGTTYECLQGHVTQADWTPDMTPALWSVVAVLTNEWQAGVWYDVDDVVMYEEIEYICIQAHTSQEGWEPSNVPALWGLV